MNKLIAFSFAAMLAAGPVLAQSGGTGGSTGSGAGMNSGSGASGPQGSGYPGMGNSGNAGNSSSGSSIGRAQGSATSPQDCRPGTETGAMNATNCAPSSGGTSATPDSGSSGMRSPGTSR